MNYSNILRQLKENREALFADVKSRITSTENDETEMNALKEDRKRAQILRNTRDVATAIMGLAYKILKEANTRTATLNVRKINKKLGEPCDKSIDDTKPSYYIFDDDSLIIYLNYSRVYYDYCDGDCGSYGGKSFLEDIDEEILKAILEEYGINYSRYESQNVESMTSTNISIITIKVKNKIKEKTV